MGDIFESLDRDGLFGRKIDRNDLIRKLKTVKNPRERDRILRLLAGQDLPETEQPKVVSPRQIPAEGPATGPSPSPQQNPPPAPESESPAPPMKGIGFLIGAIVPVFFLIMGIILVLTSLAEFHRGGNPQNVFTGIMFIVFGAIGLFKARKAVKSKT
jgi:hypothetical protein